MKLYKNLSFVLISILSISFASCSDDKEGEKKPAELVLPLEITKSYNDGTTDRSEYTFEYDATDTTRIESYKLVEYYNVNNSYTTTIYIEYNSQGQIIGTKEVDQHNREYNYIFTYAQPKTSETSNIVISKKEDDGTLIATYTVDSKGRLVMWQDELENDEYKIWSYEYSGNNISKETTKEMLEINGAKQLVVVKENTIKYNNNNGVFRNVTTPQWFLVTELEDIAKGMTGSNINTANNKEYDYEKSATPVITTQIASTSYKSFIKNFPNTFETAYKVDDKDRDEITFYEVVYNFVK